MISYLWLATFTAMLVVGQLLFKHVALAIRGRSPTDGLLAVAQSPTFYAALALYGVATLLWIWILSRVPLSQAYPWVALGTGIVPLLAWLVFNERVGSAYWIGIVLVMAGVFLTQYASEGP